ncbi:MAG TPA: TIM-barrel domain-containing protein [Gemmatimonadaceae bacterium]|nr:TIM-barrel domain-containing protein [Gemmatimonadaceae bacterium]
MSSILFIRTSRVVPFLTVIAAATAVPLSVEAQVRRTTFEAPGRYVTVEALRDDVIHFEFGTGTPPAADSPIETTMMVHKRDYTGPQSFSATARSIATADVELTVDAVTACMTAVSLPSRAGLGAFCPANLDRETSGLTITRERTGHVYGLGEQFTDVGNPDGDWVGRERVPGDPFGNKMVGFNGGAVGNAMFPIMYAVGDGGLNYALFFDNVYAQRWDFRTDPWTVEARGPLRGYLIFGPDLPDLRSDYLELVGRPPVPPKKAFGLWVSEYGFDNWSELDGKLGSLRAAAFPVDGVVMDLQWFGGIRSESDSTSMGRVAWDEATFPDPAGKITQLRNEHGLGLILIEESYIGRALSEHTELERRGFLARQSADGPATYIDYNPWWGKGGMIDWTSDSAGVFWHDWKRQPLVAMGVLGHWTDLGEPELYDSTSWYHGVKPGRHRHADVHNLYNLKWSESIFEGYRRHSVPRRPFILTRSGTSGTQRFGTALWSGDIGANLSSLATHMNAQMHMSMSGVDYFASDIGGFHRAALDGDQNEMYTQWFANGALLDVPVRPHTENLCNCKETAPDRIGDRTSNLANLRLRYTLAPYYYSLAHRAHRYGEPLLAPLVHYYQNDTSVRTNGRDKLIGRDLLVATVARHGDTIRDVYLPRGRWVDYYTNQSHSSAGELLRGVPLYRDSLFRLPLFARAGAIIPQMHVDEKTMNVEGRRTDGSRRDELLLRVYADSQESSFTLYEDDGWSVAYESDSVATTRITQQRRPGSAVVTIAAREGAYAGAIAQRGNVVHLIADGPAVTSVTLNGAALRRHATRSAFESAPSGWYVADRVVVAKTGELAVEQQKRLEFRFPQR